MGSILPVNGNLATVDDGNGGSDGGGEAIYVEERHVSVGNLVIQLGLAAYIELVVIMTDRMTATADFTKHVHSDRTCQWNAHGTSNQLKVQQRKNFGASTNTAPLKVIVNKKR